MISRIDIHRFSGDQLRVIRREDSGRRANILDADELSRRGALSGLVEQIIEMIDP